MSGRILFPPLPWSGPRVDTGYDCPHRGAVIDVQQCSIGCLRGAVPIYACELKGSCSPWRFDLYQSHSVCLGCERKTSTEVTKRNTANAS